MRLEPLPAPQLPAGCHDFELIRAQHVDALARLGKHGGSAGDDDLPVERALADLLADDDQGDRLAFAVERVDRLSSHVGVPS